MGQDAGRRLYSTFRPSVDWFLGQSATSDDEHDNYWSQQWTATAAAAGRNTIYFRRRNVASLFPADDNQCAREVLETVHIRLNAYSIDC